MKISDNRNITPKGIIGPIRQMSPLKKGNVYKNWRGGGAIVYIPCGISFLLWLCFARDKRAPHGLISVEGQLGRYVLPSGLLFPYEGEIARCEVEPCLFFGVKVLRTFLFATFITFGCVWKRNGWNQITFFFS